jgi:hypothetical protein
MWYMVHLSYGQGWLDGDTLDMSPIMDRSSDYYEKVPLPPVVTSQLDILWRVRILQQLQKNILDGLWHLMAANKPQSWMTIYLCVFILLHNCSILTLDRYRRARKHGKKIRYDQPKFVEDLHLGANILLTHYHYCNGDMDPFSFDWKNRHTTRLADLSPQEVGFLIHSAELINERSKQSFAVQKSCFGLTNCRGTVPHIFGK